MKKEIRKVLAVFAMGCFLNSCSPDSSEVKKPESSFQLVTNYTYNSSELETMKLINDYRAAIGLNRLETINHVSFKSEEHVNYMVANNVANHNDFEARAENIISVLGAKKVSENVAYNYDTSHNVLDAWLKSAGHKENIIGNFTHFGISIRVSPTNGRKYYTNIFVKI